MTVPPTRGSALQLATDLTLARVPDTGPNRPPHSVVLRHGAPTGAIVDGEVLEAVVAWRGCRLLFTTDGVPAEDALHVTFLDEAGRVRDRAEIGAPYTTGAFAGPVLVDPDRVQFRFSAGDRWVLRLLDRPRLRVPLFGVPPGVRRGLGWRRRFALARLADDDR